MAVGLFCLESLGENPLPGSFRLLLEEFCFLKLQGWGPCFLACCHPGFVLTLWRSSLGILWLMTHPGLFSKPKIANFFFQSLRSLLHFLPPHVLTILPSSAAFKVHNSVKGPLNNPGWFPYFKSNWLTNIILKYLFIRGVIYLQMKNKRVKIMGANVLLPNKLYMKFFFFTMDFLALILIFKIYHIEIFLILITQFFGASLNFVSEVSASLTSP